MDTSNQNQPQIQQTVIVLGKQKSVGVAFLLAFLFGPLGLLYASVTGGIVMILLGIIIGIITLGFGLIFVWIGSIIWAVVAANSANKNAGSGVNINTNFSGRSEQTPKPTEQTSKETQPQIKNIEVPKSMENFVDFQTMNEQRKFVLIAALVGVISIFLPWISISVSLFGYSESHSANGFRDIGILAFVCFIISGAIAYLGDQTKKLDTTMWAMTLIAGALALLSAIWFYFNNTREPLTGISVAGFGLYISGLASLGILISAYVFRSPTDNLKDGFNTLKKGIESKINTSANTTNPDNKTNNPDNTNPPA